MLQKRTISLTLNYRQITAEVFEHYRLVDFLQEDLGLSGTKVCCAIGTCRACVIAYRENSESPFSALQSCSIPATSMDGKELVTVEGLKTDGGRLHPLQQAFLSHFSFQCGYSAPGFLMAAFALMDQLAKQPVAKQKLKQVIDRAVGRHICRCGGYIKYYQAIEATILQHKGLVIDP